MIDTPPSSGSRGRTISSYQLYINFRSFSISKQTLALRVYLAPVYDFKTEHKLIGVKRFTYNCSILHVGYCYTTRLYSTSCEYPNYVKSNKTVFKIIYFDKGQAMSAEGLTNGVHKSRIPTLLLNKKNK